VYDVIVTLSLLEFVVVEFVVVVAAVVVVVVVVLLFGLAVIVCVSKV